MNENEGEVGVTVVVRRFGVDCEHQSAAALRGWLGDGRTVKREKYGANGENHPSANRAHTGRPLNRRANALLLHRNLHR